MVTSEKFCEDYFLRGPETGLSNYVDYRWMPERTIPACQRMMHHLGAKPGESIIDCGAARGFYVNAFRMLGMAAFGYDISEWAVENCHPDVRDVMSTELPLRAFDWANLKDLLEHLNLSELHDLSIRLSEMIDKGLLIIVPLAEKSGGRYIREEDEKDSTHIIRWTLIDWIWYLEEAFPEFDVSGSYHIDGIKPASLDVRHSTGFLTLKK